MTRAIDELNAPADTVVPRRTALQAELGVLDQELASPRRSLRAATSSPSWMGFGRGSGGGRLFRRSCPGSQDYSR